jgi:hypothetical protein
MEIHPKFVFDLVAGALFIAFILLMLFGSELPDVILGLPKEYWFFLLLSSSVLVRFGWRIVAYFRRGE